MERFLKQQDRGAYGCFELADHNYGSIFGHFRLEILRYYFYFAHFYAWEVLRTYFYTFLIPSP